MRGEGKKGEEERRGEDRRGEEKRIIAKIGVVEGGVYVVLGLCVEECAYMYVEGCVLCA